MCILKLCRGCELLFLVIETIYIDDCSYIFIFIFKVDGNVAEVPLCVICESY